MNSIQIDFVEPQNLGVLKYISGQPNSGWRRLQSASIGLEQDSCSVPGVIRLRWENALALFREFRHQQRQLNIKFVSTQSSRSKLLAFVEELAITEGVSDPANKCLSSEEVQEALVELGFTKRQLRPFQLRDLARLSYLPNGANFSVPGAGKTSVTLALHLLCSASVDRMLVVSPKGAFPAWSSVLGECLSPDSAHFANGEFLNLSGMSSDQVRRSFVPDNRYFITNYEHFVSLQDTFAGFLVMHRVHLVLDESHRMKAGQGSQRGAALLSISTLPSRRDILSGTPMPNSQTDLQSQLDFLWPGSRLGLRIQRGEAPSEVIHGLYARTTKKELGLPPRVHHRLSVPMSPAQGALYGIVRSDVLQHLSVFRRGGPWDVSRARGQVIRLLQLSSNPVEAIRGITDDLPYIDSPLIQRVVDEGMSPKLRAATGLARQLASQGHKSVIWTISLKNIRDIEAEIVELNPVTIYGAIPSGSPLDINTREGRLAKFHEDPSCMVLIANPATAGEGISLHTVCHEAIYVDRNYIATQYLQSLDRIHRLGLSPDTVTNVHILQSAPPQGLGSIDYSVSRRLGVKIRHLQMLLNDDDLHQVALDEELSDDPYDDSVDLDDVIDLIEELEGRAHYSEDAE